MTKVFTLTCNLLAQSYASFDSLHFGGTFRVKNEIFSVGGKGINVSRFLKNMGLESVAVFFYGGDSGKRCLEHLNKAYCLKTLAIPTNFATRTGLVAYDNSSKKETTFLGADSPLLDADFLQAISGIESRVQAGDILALCGSCPDWSQVKKDALLDLVKRKSLRLVIDTYGVPLKDLFCEESEILKINADEFSAFCKIEKTEENLDANFEKFGRLANSKFFAVTNSSKKVRARIGSEFKTVLPPQFTSPSFETGCGDMVLARLIFGLATRNSLEFDDLQDALKLASDFAKNQK